MSIILFSVLISCSSDHLISEPQEINASKADHKLTLSEAIKRAEPILMSSIYADVKTRSNPGRNIFSVEYVSKQPLTRSSSNYDVDFYIVNYGNDGGFAMLSADDRLMPVYAMSDSGSLAMEDTISNPSLKYFFDAALNSVNDPKPGGDWTFTPNDDMDERHGPWLPLYQRTIGQGEPFNMYCPLANVWQERCQAGCGPVAVEQLLSFYEYPSMVFGYFTYWEKANAGERDYDIAKVINLLGLRMNIQYGYYESSVNENNLVNIFSILDYTTPEVVDLTVGSAIAELKEHPIIVFAKSDNEHANHIWIIDGYKKYGLFHNVLTTPELKVPCYFFHCIWGHEGKNNGYFYFWSDGHLDATPDFKDAYDTSGNSSTQPVYKGIKMLKGVQPNYNYV